MRTPLPSNPVHRFLPALLLAMTPACTAGDITDGSDQATDAELRQRCGNGICERRESCSICPEDCGCEGDTAGTDSADLATTDAPDLASTSSTSINAPGTGVASVYTPNCVPIIGTDFMDAVSWTRRRVEPRDCTLVRLSTPIFVWTLPLDKNAALPMTLVVRRPLDGYSLSRSTNTPRVLLADTTLASGQYEWYVSYTNKLNVVVTSQARRFVIPSDPTLLALPTGLSFSSTVANKARPRALPSGSDFSTIVSKAQNGEYGVQYAEFIKRANNWLTTAISSVPANLSRTDFASDLEYNNWLTSVGNAAGVENVAIESLAYAGKFTGNSAFDDAGVTRLMALAAWPTDGATSEAVQDQANRKIYLTLGMGLDLFQTKLTSNQRLTIVAALKTRLGQAMAGYSGLNGAPYNSHLLTASQYILESLMYSVGTPEFPEADNLLAQAWEVFVTAHGAWGSNRDGGFANSDAYSWFTMTTLVRLSAAVRLIANLDLTRWPAMGNYGDNQLALTPADALLRSQFGDQLETTRNYFDYSWDAVRLNASVTGKPEYEWYWRADPLNVSRQVYLQPMHYLLLGIRTPAAPATTPVLSDSWIFEDAGIVAMHSKTTDSLRSSVFFRSSRFGSYNHSHADNNAFTYVSKGKEIFISGGYYPYYLSPHHANVTRATRFKNALTFNGGIGQAEPSAAPTAPGAPILSMDTRGQLINFGDSGVWAYSTGDATLAYRGQDPTTKAFTPLLSSAVRSVAYNRQERVVVIYDYATSNTARTWELNFQSLTLPILSGQTVQVVNGASQACLDVYGASGSFAISAGFPVAPEVTQPDQYHARYSASAPSTQLVSVTVIREDCRTVPVSVNVAGTSAAVSINGGVAMTFDRKTITSP